MSYAELWTSTQAWANRTHYHINPLTTDPTQLADMDFGDIAGDLFFDILTVTELFACAGGLAHTPGVICANREKLGAAIGITAVEVAVDEYTWGLTEHTTSA